MIQVETTLRRSAASFWKDKKYKKIKNDANYAPSSYTYDLTLNVIQEVKEGEDFITLCAQLQTGIIRSQQHLAIYSLRAYDMNL